MRKQGVITQREKLLTLRPRKICKIIKVIQLVKK